MNPFSKSKFKKGLGCPYSKFNHDKLPYPSPTPKKPIYFALYNLCLKASPITTRVLTLFKNIFLHLSCYLHQVETSIHFNFYLFIVETEIKKKTLITLITKTSLHSTIFSLQNKLSTLFNISIFCSLLQLV